MILTNESGAWGIVMPVIISWRLVESEVVEEAEAACLSKSWFLREAGGMIQCEDHRKVVSTPTNLIFELLDF